MYSFQSRCYQSIGYRFPFNKSLLIAFLRMLAIPSKCWLSSLHEQRTVSPVSVFILPEPAQQLSLTPTMHKLYRLISDVTYTSLPVLYIVRTFQNHILVLIFALSTSRMPAASLRISPLAIIFFAWKPLRTADVFDSFVAFSVMKLFLHDRVVGPMSNPLLGGPGIFYQGFFPLDKLPIKADESLSTRFDFGVFLLLY